MCSLMAYRGVGGWNTLSRGRKFTKFNHVPVHRPWHQTGSLNHHHHHGFLRVNLLSLILFQH